MRLKEIGYKDLTCVDLYANIPENHTGIRHIKGELTDIPSETENKFDLITMHHSFEHMNNPDEILHKCTELLKEKGLLIIRIPLMGKKAWKIYGTDWYQIDAPRHYFLYTEKAMELLVKRNHLYIEKIIYDSAPDQLKRSEMYKETKYGFNDFDKKSINKSDYRMARRLNHACEGDQACFYIRKV